MRVFIDLAGKRFGRLVAIKRVGTYCGSALWQCQCICGNTVEVSSQCLRLSRTKSCGCFQREVAAEMGRRNGASAHPTHGMSRTKIYTTWKSMMHRCYNAKYPNYRYYGGRGIMVFQAWHDLAGFRDWVLTCFSDGQIPDGLSIDRKDSNGNYEPSNCRWATAKEQQSNTRRKIQAEHRMAPNCR